MENGGLFLMIRKDVSMASKDLMSIYIQQLNDYLLPTIDFKELDDSCNSPDNQYAKETLKRMHDIFVDVYGTTELDSSYGFVCVPAVIRGRYNNKTALGLVELDLESSGEHWGTTFFLHQGIVDQNSIEKTAAGARAVKPFIPYNYWYTAQIPEDIHISQSPPDDLQDFLDFCQPHEEQSFTQSM